MKHTTPILVALAALFVAAPASAQIRQVFAFEGTLQHDGEPVNGQYAMRFAGYDAPTDGTLIYQEEWSDLPTRSCGGADACLVNVFAGVFRVPLGAYAPPASTDALYLEVEVRDNAGTWFPLRGRQAVLATPYSHWTIDASSLTAGGDMQVNGNLQASTLDVVGAANFPSLSATGLIEAGSLRLTGALGSGGVTAVSGTVYSAGNFVFTTDLSLGPVDTFRPAVRHAAGDVLQLNPAGSYTRTYFEPGFATRGNLTVNGFVRTTAPLFYFGGRTYSGRARTDHPILSVRYMNIGTSDWSSTGRNDTDWFCWVGGHRFENGDFDEFNSGTPIMSLYTYTRSGTWYVAADTRSHSSGHETHEVEVICLQRTMIEEMHTSWW